MKRLYFANFKGLSAFSELIKFQTDGPFSHTAIWLDFETKKYIKSFIGESEYKRLNIDNMQLMEQWPHNGNFLNAWFDYNDLGDHTPGTEFEIWSLELSIYDWEYCIAHYINSIKEPYDWAGIAHFRIKSVSENPDKSFCSEKAIQPIANILGWKNINPFNINPNLFVGLMQVARGTREEVRSV